jgi:hypothetical protein
MDMWAGMAHCPVEECRFTVRIDSSDEADLDTAAVAAFAAHAERAHPGRPLSLQGYLDEQRPRLLN